MALTDTAAKSAKPCEKPVGKDNNGKPVYETVDGPYKLADECLDAGGLLLAALASKPAKGFGKVWPRDGQLHKASSPSQDHQSTRCQYHQ